MDYFKEGVLFYEKAIQINPKEYQAWEERGLILLALNKLEDAIDSFDNAILANPDACIMSWSLRNDAFDELANR